MRTSRVVRTALLYATGTGCLVAVLGLCAAFGGIISESPTDTAMGWLIASVGTAVLRSAVMLLLAGRPRIGRS